MSINPLNDITKVYLEQVVESSHLETDMEKRRKNNEKAIEDMKKTKAHKDMVAAIRKKFDEAMDPVGKEDADIDNDGDTDKSDKYLHKRRKAIGKAISKRGMKEGFSNWREELDLFEITDKQQEKKITEKKVNNSSLIKINPRLGEAVEEMGATLLEMVEIDEFDFVVESAYVELLDEGYEEDEIEEALEYALTEAKVTFGHDTPSSGNAEKKKEGLLSAARKRLSGAKTAAKAAVAKGARKVAKGALGVARKIEGDKKPHTAERKPATYRGAGAGQKEKVSSGSYQGPAKKKSEPIADPWKGSATKPSKPKPKPASKPIEDPWKGSETTPSKPKPKAATKKTAAPKATSTKAKAPAAKKRKKSNLDNLLASIRNEEVQLDEKALSRAQQRFMGMVYAAKKGGTPASSEVAKAAAGMTEKEAKKFAKTKHKGLPEKKVQEQASEIQPKQQSQQKAEKSQGQNKSAINAVLMAKSRVDSAQKELAQKQRSAAQKGVDLQSMSA